MGEVHTSRDKEISYLEVDQILSEFNGHVSMWTKILSIGDAWGHRDRIRESWLRASKEIPEMQLLVKDHKKQRASLTKTDQA